MITLPTMITAKWLSDRGACTEHQKLFEREWPNGAFITKANLIRAAHLGLDLLWFLGMINPISLDTEHENRNGLYAKYKVKRDSMYAKHEENYALLNAKYKTNCDLLDAEYETKHDSMYVEYKVKRTTLDNEHLTERATLDAEYDANIAPLVAEYQLNRSSLTLNILLELYES